MAPALRLESNLRFRGDTCADHRFDSGLGLMAASRCTNLVAGDLKANGETPVGRRLIHDLYDVRFLQTWPHR